MSLEVFGTGTKHYGCFNWIGDSYETTRWISVAGLPIYPLETYRVQDLGIQSAGPFATSSGLRVLERIPHQRRQIAITYALMYAYVLLMVAVAIGLVRHIPFFGPSALLTAVVLPIVGKLVWNIRQRAKARSAG